MEMTPQQLMLNGDELWIYSSSSPIDAGQVLMEFDEESEAQFIWANAHLIVQYRGNDVGTVMIMDGLFGEPLVNPPAAGNEPYPPAIPAAISSVAHAFEAKPNEIEVLDYQMREWPNACLGLPEREELCAEERTTGWWIELRAAGVVLEVHTDIYGENLRWIAK